DGTGRAGGADPEPPRRVRGPTTIRRRPLARHRAIMNRTVLIIGLIIVAAVVSILFMGPGKDPAHIESPLIGRPAPGFALKAVGSDETIDLTRYRGKPVVLNFWATWCVPCWDEHPVLTANAQMAGDRVQYLG